MRFVPDDDKTTPAPAGLRFVPDDTPDPMANFLATGDPSRAKVAAPPVEQQLTQGPLPTPVGPDAIVNGQPVSPTALGGAGKPIANAITSAAQGFNKLLASYLAIPINDANVIMSQAGKAFLSTGDATGAINDAMAKAGFGNNTAASMPMFEHVGAEVLPQILTAAATMGLAPAAAAVKGTGALASGLRETGEFALKHPGAIVGGSIGSAVGGPVGETALPAAARGLNAVQGVPAPSPALQSALEMIGGLGGSMLGGGLGAGASAFGRPGGAETGIFPVRGGGLVNKEVPLGTEPVARAATDFTPIRERVSAMQQNITSMYDDALKTVTTPEDTITAGQKWVAATRTAWKNASAQVSSMWKTMETDGTLKLPMNTAGAKALAKATIQSIRDPSSRKYLPRDILSAMNRLPKNASLGRMQELLSNATAEAREATNTRTKLYLNDIITGLKTEIDNAFPDNQDIKAATYMTKWLHDTFDRSAMAHLAQTKIANPAELGSGAKQAMRAVQSETAGTDLANLQSAMPVTGVDVATPADQFIRATIQKITTNPLNKENPAAAELWASSPSVQRMAKEYPQIEATTNAYITKVKAAREAAEAMKSNKFYMAAESDPSTAVRKVFHSMDPLHNAKQVVKDLGADPLNGPAAIDALQTSTAQHIMSETNLDPTKLREWMNQASNRAALDVIYKDNPGKLAQLEQISRDMVKYASGDETLMSQVMHPIADLGGRITGMVAVAPLPGNQLVKAGVGSRLGRDLVARLFKDFTPQELFLLAVDDPRWAQFLHAKVPSNLAQLKAMNTRLGQLTGAIQYGADETRPSDAGSGQPTRTPLEITVGPSGQ